MVLEGDRALGDTMCVGTLGNILDMSGKEGEAGNLVQVMSRSEMATERTDIWRQR